jgi:hypothetical protein
VTRIWPLGLIRGTPAQWELFRLRSIDHVVRMGHIRRIEAARIVLADGEVSMPCDAVVVHCAAAGLQYPPLVPIWGDEATTLQPIRTGFPCFGAALAGYVEATREDDEEKNRLYPRHRSRTRCPDGHGCRCSGRGHRWRSPRHPTSSSGADRTTLTGSVRRGRVVRVVRRGTRRGAPHRAPACRARARCGRPADRRARRVGPRH